MRASAEILALAQMVVTDLSRLHDRAVSDAVERRLFSRPPSPYVELALYELHALAHRPHLTRDDRALRMLWTLDLAGF